MKGLIFQLRVDCKQKDNQKSPDMTLEALSIEDGRMLDNIVLVVEVELCHRGILFVVNINNAMASTPGSERDSL